MNTVTTADLRNEFRRVSAWLDNGESVQILKRGKPYATLVPAAKPQTKQPPKVDFKAQRDSIWKGRKFSAVEVAEMRKAELDDDFC
jgi:antitoxin (DNA-binding transcriptional repressor) of toxin-antitoxin stability system